MDSYIYPTIHIRIWELYVNGGWGSTVNYQAKEKTD